ncbi:hypothetical protein BJX63DRAFT_272133 [Aspergillus granulosus]|uniref:Uncharacterized protein n=1 Tax=Aspergillus granulosus TaxID=176169 RepID=A0ABR4H8W4_9EURO
MVAADGMQLVSSIQKSQRFAVHQSLPLTVYEIGARSYTLLEAACGNFSFSARALGHLSNGWSFLEHSLESKWARLPKPERPNAPCPSGLWYLGRTTMRNSGPPVVSITRPFANRLYSKLPPPTHLSSPPDSFIMNPFMVDSANGRGGRNPGSINQFPILVAGAAVAEIVFGLLGQVPRWARRCSTSRYHLIEDLGNMLNARLISSCSRI